MNDQLVACMNGIMNEFGAAMNMQQKRVVMLRYSCPPGMVNPGQQNGTPPSEDVKSGDGESCTKTADCRPGLRCVKLTCVNSG